jgi:hypothetical protein
MVWWVPLSDYFILIDADSATHRHQRAMNVGGHPLLHHAKLSANVVPEVKEVDQEWGVRSVIDINVNSVGSLLINCIPSEEKESKWCM